jgi:hypothetical protein
MIMTQQPGYQEGNERTWWWRVAQHIDAAQLALVNAATLNKSDPASVIALQERMREAQAILLHIFRAKGLMTSFNGAASAPKAGAADASMPPMPLIPASPPPGVPMPLSPMDVSPLPAPPPQDWMPTDGVLGAWVSADPPSSQEIASSSTEELLAAPTEAAEIGEDEVAVVQAEVLVPAASASADPIPEA